MKTKTKPGTLYTCSECKTDVVLVPPLSQRKGADGQAMTREEALSIFRDGRGGKCTDCYLTQRSGESVDLMRKIGAEQKPAAVMSSPPDCDACGGEPPCGGLSILRTPVRRALSLATSCSRVKLGACRPP